MFFQDGLYRMQIIFITFQDGLEDTLGNALSIEREAWHGLFIVNAGDLFLV